MEWIHTCNSKWGSFKIRFLIKREEESEKKNKKNKRYSKMQPLQVMTPSCLFCTESVRDIFFKSPKLYSNQMKDFGDSNLDLVFVLKHLKEKSRGISSWVGGWAGR